MTTKSRGRRSGPKNGQKRIQKNSRHLLGHVTIVEELGILPSVVLLKEEVKASQKESPKASPKARAKANQKDPQNEKERPKAKARVQLTAVGTVVGHTTQ